MNGCSEASGMCRKQRLYPAAWASFGPIVEFTRAGEHCDPESILCRVAAFGLEVLMLKKMGRGVTRPLHWKNNKCTWAWLQTRHSYVKPHWLRWSIGEVVSFGSSNLLFSPGLTSIHSSARCVVSVPSPPVHILSCRCWFMVSRLGKVCQKVSSLSHRVSLMMNPQVVFVLGGPGAGKGTQCSRITEVSRIGRNDNENYRLWRLRIHTKWWS